MNWKKVSDELPKLLEKVVVAAWEFGCEPEFHICTFWQSSETNQPPRFFIDDTPPMEVGSVRLWASLALPETAIRTTATEHETAVAKFDR
jgi:hypothetical protein